jgi:hypothetical protein
LCIIFSQNYVIKKVLSEIFTTLFGRLSEKWKIKFKMKEVSRMQFLLRRGGGIGIEM